MGVGVMTEAYGRVGGQGELGLSLDTWETLRLQSAPGRELMRRWLLPNYWGSPSL